MFRLEKLGMLDPRKTLRAAFHYIQSVQLKQDPETQIVAAAVALLALSRRSKARVPEILGYAERILADPEVQAMREYTAMRLYEGEQIHDKLA